LHGYRATTATTAPASGSSAAPTAASPDDGLQDRDSVAALNGNVGTDYTGFIEASGGQGGPIRWSLVAGRVPNGMQFAGDSLRLTQTTAVLGRPTTVQTTSFTVEARDQAGATTRKTFSLTIDPPRPLVITNGTDQLTRRPAGSAPRTRTASSPTAGCRRTAGRSSPVRFRRDCR
jgi:hypothetical protein